MTIIRRDLLKRALAYGEPLRPAANRGYGKTTSAVLRAIADSMHNPGAWIIIDDVECVGKSHAANLEDYARKVVRTLGLREISFKIEGDTVCIKNDFCERL